MNIGNSSQMLVARMFKFLWNRAKVGFAVPARNHSRHSEVLRQPKVVSRRKQAITRFDPLAKALSDDQRESCRSAGQNVTMTFGFAIRVRV
jgi:hypothetical protein